MEINSITQILDMACTNQRRIVEHVLRLQGYIPMYGKDSYGKLPKEIADKGVSLCIDLMKKYRDNDFNSVKKNINNEYMPDLSEKYLTDVFGVEINGRTRLTINGIDYIYDDKSGRGRFYEMHTRNCDYSVFFVSKLSNRSIYDVLDDYYRSIYGSKKLDASLIGYFRELVGKSNDDIDNSPLDKGKPVEISLNAYGDKVESIVPTSWMPAPLNKDKSFYIKSYAKNANGYTTDHRGPICIQIGVGESRAWTTVYGDLPSESCKKIDICKDWLVSRHMHRAINAPYKGWRVDYRRGCVVYNGVYTLCGRAKSDKVRKTLPCRVAELRRYMQPHNGHLKEFAKGSKSIPYLLDNLSLRDKTLIVCEGVPDACFVKNGIAINCWMPSTDTAQPIIDYFQHEKKMRVIYVSDNWAVGDKGGRMMLDWYRKNKPNAEIFDWTSFTDDFSVQSKDIGELVVEMISRGDDRFIVEGESGEQYQMPRELILSYTRPAKNINYGLYEYNLYDILDT